MSKPQHFWGYRCACVCVATISFLCGAPSADSRSCTTSTRIYQAISPNPRVVYFSDYNSISFFPFLPLNPPLYLTHSPSNVWALLSPIFLLHRYTYIFLNVTCVVCTVFPLCLFSGLIIWNWTAAWYALLWGDSPSHPQPSAATCESIGGRESRGQRSGCWFARRFRSDVVDCIVVSE